MILGSGYIWTGEVFIFRWGWFCSSPSCHGLIWIFFIVGLVFGRFWLRSEPSVPSSLNSGWLAFGYPGGVCIKFRGGLMGPWWVQGLFSFNFLNNFCAFCKNTLIWAQVRNHPQRRHWLAGMIRILHVFAWYVCMGFYGHGNDYGVSFFFICVCWICVFVHKNPLLGKYLHDSHTF